MKDAAKVFAIIVSIMVGGILVYQQHDMLEPRFLYQKDRLDLRQDFHQFVFGIILLGAGLTGAWMMRKKSR